MRKREASFALSSTQWFGRFESGPAGIQTISCSPPEGFARESSRPDPTFLVHIPALSRFLPLSLYAHLLRLVMGGGLGFR